MIRMMAPVEGSRSTRAVVGMRLFGAEESTERESWEHFRAEDDFSVPPVEELSFDVKPRRR